MKPSTPATTIDERPSKRRARFDPESTLNEDSPLGAFAEMERDVSRNPTRLILTPVGRLPRWAPEKSSPPPPRNRVVLATVLMVALAMLLVWVVARAG